MLALEFRPGESVTLRNTATGEDYTIRIVKRRGDIIRLAFDAPRHVEIIRDALLAEWRSRRYPVPDSGPSMCAAQPKSEVSGAG